MIFIIVGFIKTSHLKYGLIRDKIFFEWLETNIDRLLTRDKVALAYAIEQSCLNKAQVVSEDETETGVRATLNLGHTFGHAIEVGMGYGEWLHGEAVGCGIVLAAHLSQRLGLVDATFVQRLTTLIQQAGLPVKAPLLSRSDNAGRYLELMRVDKKAEGGEIRFVVVNALASASLRTAPDALVREVIDLCCT